MPRQSRKDLKQVLWQMQDYFAPFIGRCACTFGPHTFDVSVKGVILARQSDMTNVPDKRLSDGKYYTPDAIIIACEEGKMIFVLEDIDNIILTTDSVRVIMGETTICFTSRGSNGSC
jgi:hypothetical protein